MDTNPRQFSGHRQGTLSRSLADQAVNVETEDISCIAGARPRRINKLMTGSPGRADWSRKPYELENVELIEKRICVKRTRET